MNKNPRSKRSSSWKREITLLILGVAGILTFFYLMGVLTVTHYPNSLALDNQGNLYISDDGIAQTQKFNRNGEQLSSIGTRGDEPDKFRRFWGPKAITVDRQGNLYAAADERAYLLKFDNQGHFAQNIETGRVPRRLLTNNQEHLLVLFEDAPFVVEYDNAGQQVTAWGAAGQNPGQLAQVSTFATDSQDNVYIVAGGLLHKFDSQGHFLLRWALPPLKDSSFSRISLNSQGQIYLANASSIYKYDQQGNLLTSWQPPDYTYQNSDMVVSAGGTVYVLGKKQHQPVVLTYDSSGHQLNRWTSGLPSWFTNAFNYGQYFIYFLIFIIGRLLWQSKIRVQPTDTEPLPAWVETGKANPQLLYDHLELQKVKTPPTPKSLRKRVSLWIGGTALLILFVLVAWTSFTLLDDAGIPFSQPFFIMLSLVVIGMALAYWLEAGIDQPSQSELEKENRLSLIRQVQSTLPEGNRRVLVTGRRLKLREMNWSAYWLYWGFYLPMAIPVLTELNFFTFGGNWPGWAVETLVVDGLGCLGLGFFWLRNSLQKDGPGRVRLSRQEMWELWGRAWLTLGGFIVLTIGLGLFNDANTHPANSYEYNLAGWGFIGLFVRYGLLAWGLGRISGRWLNPPVNEGNYELATRRFTYVRGWNDSLSMRLRHADLLRLAGRFQEAEYILQESLAKPYYQNAGSLASILANLGKLRLDQERYAEAMFLLESSLKQSSYQPENYNTLAEVYLRLSHRPDRAIELINRSDKDSDSKKRSGITDEIAADHSINLAWAYAQRGDWPQAERMVGTALIKAKAGNKPALASLRLKTGLVLQLKGDYQAAIENYRQATTVDPAGYHGQKAAEYLAYNRAALPTT